MSPTWRRSFRARSIHRVRAQRMAPGARDPQAAPTLGWPHVLRCRTMNFAPSCAARLTSTLRRFFPCLCFVLCGTCGLFGCNDPGLHAFFRAQPLPLVFAHRFGGGVEPEETIPTMLHTHLRNPSAVLEFDVQVSSDNVLVVIHDDTVDRTTNGTGRVDALTLAALKALDAGYCATPNQGNGTAKRGDCHSADPSRFPFRGHGYVIPTLEEVLDALPAGALFSVEVKAAGIESRVVEILRARGRLDQLILGAEADDVAARLKELLPSVPSYYPEGAAKCLALTAKIGWDYTACPHFECFASPLSGAGLALDTKAILNRAHADGVAVVYWTINDAPTMERLFRLGADGIYTDYPDTARAVLESVRADGVLK